LGFSGREIELARIAGYLHDIGNAVNRIDHAHSGAILAYDILARMGMDYKEAAEIMLAIGNHDEGSGTAVSNVSAALILADKSDVHRTRVRNNDIATFDIHDRVNYAVEESRIYVEKEKKLAILDLHIDTEICPVMDYFEIFLVRMTMNRKAAEFLGLKFQLIINGTHLL
ncbi:MAG: HD domain-containing protein, partial [Clostridiaceae bacterium]|nr:HD domain-containing protein [Clostridiaceae bacterium]